MNCGCSFSCMDCRHDFFFVKTNYCEIMNYDSILFDETITLCNDINEVYYEKIVLHLLKSDIFSKE